MSDEFEDAIFWPYNKYETMMIKLLSEIFKDEEEGWINYYIYELEFGKRWKPGYIIDNGRDIKMETPGDLYDYLIECYDKD